VSLGECFNLKQIATNLILVLNVVGEFYNQFLLEKKVDEITNNISKKHTISQLLDEVHRDIG